jgi:polysaccharide export outer membrane protein
MIRNLFGACLVLGITLCSCSIEKVTRDTDIQSSALPAQSSAPFAQAETSLIMIGDSIGFSVWGYPEFTTRALVNLAGTITVPFIGEITAAGYTREEFIASLRRRLAEFIKGEIRLTIEIFSPLPRITILGAVSRQGSFPANKDVSLLEVLSDAGGWTEQSDLRYIKISRQTTSSDDGRIIEIDLERHLETGSLRSLPVVHPGDVVYVPVKENVIRQAALYLGDAFLLFGFFRLLQ